MAPKTKTILITGGAGFIGSAFAKSLNISTNKIVIIDKLTYAGSLQRLEHLKKTVTFYKQDICRYKSLEKIFLKEKPDIVYHFAAETHVDRSNLDIKPFTQSNVAGTQNVIQASIKSNIKKFIHISTDEVYGSIAKGSVNERAALKPSNPYAITKALADQLVMLAININQFPAIIVRPVNTFGPWQYPEKFIPLAIIQLLDSKKVPLYGKGHQIRCWLSIEDCIEAIHLISKKGTLGEVYNIGSSYHQDNLSTAKTILKKLGKTQREILYVKDRLNHDFRYSVNYQKLKKLGWKQKHSFTKTLDDTIAWVTNQRPWCTKKRKELQNYWKDIYKSKN